jgi:peptidase A4-like protein
VPFHQRLILGFALVLVTLAAIVPADKAVSASKNRRTHSPIQIQGLREDGTVGSLNWGGYAVRGSNITDAKGSWIVPAVDCSENAKDHYAAFWTGIDGYSSSTVEQTGTDSDCVKGQPSYYAWFEFFPNPSFTVGDFPVIPGDSIEAEVSYDETSQLFTVHLHDLTSGQSFKIRSAVPNAQRTSAEWIAEAPANAKKILPLSRFSSVFFGHYYTDVATTNYATVNGATGSIGTFGKISEIVMVKEDGSIAALPSPLSSNGSSFAVTRE